MTNALIKIRRIFISFILILLWNVLYPAAVAHGQDYVPLTSPSVILVEETTGKVLYTKNERARMYPASMTKILTALVVLDYLSPDDVLTVGGEIRGIPADYYTALHFEGESITVRNLLRALLIRSGNETSCILAINTIRAKESRQNIPYEDAERLFCNLMNEKAHALGALDSNFANPYGYHTENHYTTAYDLALICRAYMENDTLREIAGERAYAGDSLDGRVIDGAKTQEYEWASHNELLLGGPNSYPYATGIKTGFTDEAGYCLAASATKKDISLIAVIFFTPEPDRWQDAKLLFEYGFETYAYETVQEKDVPLGTVIITNPRLGEDDKLTVLADDEFIGLLSKEEREKLQMTLVYDEAYIDKTDPAITDALLAPIEQDAVLGTVAYTLDGETLFTGTVRAAGAAEERTFDSDMDYYISTFKNSVFTLKALPYWFGVVGLLVGIIGIAAAVSSRRSRRRRDGRRGRDYYRGYR